MGFPAESFEEIVLIKTGNGLIAVHRDQIGEMTEDVVPPKNMPKHWQS